MSSKITLAFFLSLRLWVSNSQSIEWVYFFDNSSYGNCIEKTFLGDYIFGGNYLEKDLGALFDDEGNNYWQESFCNCAYNSTSYNTELPDGRILFVGVSGDFIATNSDGKKVDSLFNISMGDHKYDTHIFKGVRQDSILILIGYTVIHKKSGSTIQKINLNNLRIVSQEFDSINTNLECINYFQDGSELKCFSNITFQYVIKTDKNGKELWKKFFYLKYADIKDMIITDNNSIYLAGTSRDTSGQRHSDGIIIKLDSSGAMLWTKYYHANHSKYPPFGYKSFNRIKSIDNNEIILGGADGDLDLSQISDISIIGIDSTGNIKWEVDKNIFREGNDVTDFIFNYDLDIIAVGTAGKSDFNGPERAFILKLKKPVTATMNPKFSDFEIFPNPASNSLTIQTKFNLEEAEIFISNLFGETKYKSQFKEQIDISSLEVGQYFIRLKSKGSMSTQKLTVIK